MFNSQSIKNDFPILQKKIHGKSLVYLDNAATSQKPQQVIDAISHYYQNNNANVHRGVHALSDQSTNIWEESRKTVASFFAADPEQLIITRNTTEAINGIAYGWGDHNLQKGDVILASVLEHHSTLVVWHELCRRTGAQIEFVGIKENGSLDLDELVNDLSRLDHRVKLCSLIHVSNTLGVVQPIERVVSLIRHRLGDTAAIVLDAAQSAPHMQLDTVALDVDWLVFSGHKMLGPMGIGGMIVKKERLEQHLNQNQSSTSVAGMSPWLFGGGMINEVTQKSATFHHDLHDLFTAGTPDVASLVGLATACEYLTNIGMHNVLDHDEKLVEYALDMLSKIEKVSVVGPQTGRSERNDLQRLGSVAFLYRGVHAHDVAQILDSEGVAVRSGHHCTMPLHRHFGWQATTRASFQVYNSKDDIDCLVAGLAKVDKVFG